METAAWFWMFVVVGGPVLLIGALIWVKLRNAPTTARRDPSTPSDNPSKGMTGHGD